MGKPFTRTQAEYLSFIHAYTTLHGCPPAEADMQAYFGVTPPTVHNMVMTLDARGFIARQPGRARSIRLLVSPETLPPLGTTPERSKEGTANPGDGDLGTLEKRLPPWTRELLPCLTDRQRQALVLHETGMTKEVIARTLDVTPNRVDQLVQSGTEALVLAARRGVALQHLVPTVEPHDPPTCPAVGCLVPAAMRGALDIEIWVLPLTAPVCAGLRSLQVNYVGQLVQLREHNLFKVRGLGHKSALGLRAALAAIGLHLGMDVGDWTPPRTRGF
jgi:repressor LexA